ncbi:response regulator [Azoarcus communis]|nr:response regulator [Parazoarcus communis]
MPVGPRRMQGGRTVGGHVEVVQPQGRILIVEDDLELLEVMRDFLSLSGYEVEGVPDGRAFRSAVVLRAFDLILLDLNLPDCDGLDLLATLRQTGNVLLFVVSGRHDGSSKVRALELGADDYIVKPFSAVELALRIRNALRRSAVLMAGARQGPEDSPGECFAGWKVDECGRVLVHVSGVRLNPTRAEYELFRVLVDARGAVVSREQLLDRLSVTAHVSNPETLTALVYRLRRKLLAAAGESPIVTLSGVGYRLNA